MPKIRASEADRARVTFCGTCGREVAWEAKRCPRCGAKRTDLSGGAPEGASGGSGARRTVRVTLAVLCSLALVVILYSVVHRSSDSDPVVQELRRIEGERRLEEMRRKADESEARLEVERERLRRLKEELDAPESGGLNGR